jgi:hypothetical protein
MINIITSFSESQYRAVLQRDIVSEDPTASISRIIRNNRTMDSVIFWDIVLCIPHVNRNLGGTYYLHLLIFNPEDGGDTFLQNISSHLDFMALYPRRRQHSQAPL